jgi:Cu2+-exporting ATPase/Cu+-exporting ATPase
MVKTITIEGLSCHHCVARTQTALNGIDGVEAKVDLASKTATVTVPDGTSDQVLIDAVTGAGYEVVSIA